MDVIIILLVLILLVLIFRRHRPTRAFMVRKCPHCHGEAATFASVCPNCGRDIPQYKWGGSGECRGVPRQLLLALSWMPRSISVT
jgi:hypothetical protein